MSHTATPWMVNEIGEICPVRKAGESQKLLDHEKVLDYVSACNMSDEDKAFIVLAVNAHAALVKALKSHDAAIKQLSLRSYLGTSTHNETMEALRLAGEL